MRDLVLFRSGLVVWRMRSLCVCHTPSGVGISGLAASPAGSCSGGDSGQGSRPGQRLVHLDQSCPDHSLDVTRQGLEVDGEPDPLSSTYP